MAPLAKAFREYTNCTVWGFDRDPAVLDSALTCGAIDFAGAWDDLGRLDLLILALYPQAAVAFVREHGAKLSRSCLVTDTCGIKTKICADLSALAREYGFRFAGSHPMAGREKVGFAASEASLFRGASYLITPMRRVGGGCRPAAAHGAGAWLRTVRGYHTGRA